MTTKPDRIPDLTLETLSRTFFRDASNYGFTHVDYVRFVNLLLDLAMKNGADGVDTNRAKQQRSGTDGSEEAVSKDVQLPLMGTRVSVRRFQVDQDLRLFEEWLSDDQGRYFLLSRATAERMDIQEVASRDDSVLGIITLPDSTPIGSVAFLDYDPVQRKAELRKLIGDPLQRKRGLAREAVALWIRYGVTALKLKKIYLNTLETDLRNVKLNEGLGFKVEGVLRNEVLIDGVYHDVLRMGLWRD